MENKLSYYEQRDLKNRLKMGKYLEVLPDYCLDFFIGIENNTSSLTRYNYAMDLNVFYDYLAEFVFKKDKQSITYEDLNKLKSRDIEQFLSYLSYYNGENNKISQNKERGKARKNCKYDK